MSENKSYSIEEWRKAVRAHSISNDKDYDIISVEERPGGMIMLTIENWRTDNPEIPGKVVAEAGGTIHFAPIFDAEVIEEETPEETTAAETPDNVIPIEEETEEPDREATLRQRWKEAGMPEDDFDPKQLDTIEGMLDAEPEQTELPEPTDIPAEPEETEEATESETEPEAVEEKPARKPKEVDPSTARMNKVVEKGEFRPMADYLDELGIEPDQLDAAIEELLDVFNHFVAGCQYSGEFRKVKARLINTNTTIGYTEMIRRIVDVYPNLVKFGLVEDKFTLEHK